MIKIERKEQKNFCDQRFLNQIYFKEAYQNEISEAI